MLGALVIKKGSTIQEIVTIILISPNVVLEKVRDIKLKALQKSECERGKTGRGLDSFIDVGASMKMREKGRPN